MSDEGRTTVGAAGLRSDHRVGFFERQPFLIESIVTFVLPALRAGQMGVVATTPEQHEQITRVLAASGLDVDASLKRGDFLQVTPDDALAELMVDGEIDPGRFRAFAGALLAIADERDCEIRITGDLASQLWRRGDPAGALVLESLWNTLPDAHPFEMLCMYPTWLFDSDAVTEDFVALCELHTDVIPDESYSHLADPVERRREIARLQQQHRAARHDTRRLVAANARLEADMDRSRTHAAELERQWGRAIESRDVIGQAKGVLMTRFHVDADTAFHMLRGASSRSNLKVHDVARTVVRQGPNQT